MSERKFTNEEIKEAFECCCKTSGCDIRCPFSGRADRDMCVKYFLDLVDCKQAEIESLQRQLHNSKLHEKECYEARRVLLMEKDHDTKMTKAEAIKEFAERLHKATYDYRDKREMPMLPYTGYALDYVDEKINNLVKEMVGDEND